jgi:GDP-mannose transporter
MKLIKLDDLSNPTRNPLVIGYAKYALLFLVGVYSNMRALQTSNVDTVIVFRSSTPLLVCAADTIFMGRQFPEKRSIAAMLLMVAGAVSYVATDAAFSLHGFSSYIWVTIYFLAISAEMVFGKMLTRDLKCELGTSVLLTNAITLPAMAALSWMTNESWSLDALWDNPLVTATLLVSFLVGTGIGFASWWCRSLLSSTSFTIVGIVNKVLTIILNIGLWDKHASAWGTASLFVCLGGGVLYKQAPMAEGASSSTMRNSGGVAGGGGGNRGKGAAQGDDEVVEMLLFGEQEEGLGKNNKSRKIVL